MLPVSEHTPHILAAIDASLPAEPYEDLVYVSGALLDADPVGYAVVPVTREMLPLTSGGVLPHILSAMAQGLKVQRVTMWGDERPVERVTDAAFSPVVLPSGRTVNYAEYTLRFPTH